MQRSPKPSALMRGMQVRILSHLLCDSISNSDSRDIGLISISTVLWRVGRIGKCSGSLIQRRLLRHGGSSPSHVVSLSIDRTYGYEPWFVVNSNLIESNYGELAQLVRAGNS